MINKIMAFVKEFENEFGRCLEDVLQETTEDGKIVRTTRKFNVIGNLAIGNIKYSDWDLHCRLVELTDTSSVLKIINFLKGYKFYIHPAIIVTCDVRHNHLDHHVENCNQLQIMSFFPNEISSPFMDLTISNVSNSIIRELQVEYSNSDFNNWFIITTWR